MTSDRRLLSNIEPITQAVERLVKVQAVSCSESTDPSHRKKYRIIAQEIHSLFPEIVTGDYKDSLDVNYLGMIPILVAAIKEQQLQIEGLERRLETKE